MHMLSILLLPLLIIISYSQPILTTTNVLTQGSSLVVKKGDHLVSPNRLFTAGFHQIGQNAYLFAIWFTELTSDGSRTLVWMANRDLPINGKRSEIFLSKTGNLVLSDAGQQIWASNTKSTSPLQLQLLDSGNLVLNQVKVQTQSYIWQSFNFPTNTLLPNQPFTKNTVLISSRSWTNYSSGFYKFYFDNDNVLSILFKNDVVTSVFWPKPWLIATEAGRSTFNNSRFAFLDSRGKFTSTDNYSFVTSDYGQIVPRRLTLDVDGDLRVYTLNQKKWSVSLQTTSLPCLIHGSCGLNSICTYSREIGRICTCAYGYKAKNRSDLSLGCEPTFNVTQNRENYGFIRYPNMEFYGFDSSYTPGISLETCKNTCLNDTNCKAVQYSFDPGMGVFKCYVKIMLFNGHSLDSVYTTYVKVPKSDVLAFYQKIIAKESELNCSSTIIEVERSYIEKTPNESIKFMLWFSIILGAIEVALFLVIYYTTKQLSSGETQSYVAVGSGFRRFTYDEIVKASRKFREEIGRGGSGIVYKGVLLDNRVVAIKQLNEATQGEAEFLAEIRTIERINHRNLIEMYGYCAEKKHRILVYEYMENGSLAEMLVANRLDWQKILAIAIGVAKGLAYLHEECLEWVLHCDVKPHNILLDLSYSPKVADFGLSKLFERSAVEGSSFSRIRGTRGYMAPEWMFNLPITSKVDVYSYGVVILEMITGKSPLQMQQSSGENSGRDQTLVEWVRDKIRDEGVEEVVDVETCGEYDTKSLKNVLKIALQCAEEDRDARPSMSQVVHMLLHPDFDD
ncbi:putative receptor protein kinase ZmPK1 [Rutidosis leptorrhynchoides]|uniref:putative receptor protein kinase ZmPK1 n=1 Tax=Rutidosis leptorrhynchoides TaxID=125765 RepID=UPI003A99057E